MLDTWDQRARRDRIVVTKISFPVPPPSMDDLADRLLSADHAADEGPALLPHHQPHRPDLSGEEDLRRRAREGHQDHRRRRARVRALPVQGGGSRLRLLRHQPAQVAARADRHRLSLRPAREHRSAVAADAGQRDAREGHPQVRGDRHAPGGEPQRDRRGADLPRGDRHRAQGRAPALPAQPLGGAPAARRAASRSTRAWIRRSRARSAPCRSSASRPPRSSPQLWDKWRIIATPIVHAEYKGMRVTPNVYTTLEEIDTFAGAMRESRHRESESGIRSTNVPNY